MTIETHIITIDTTLIENIEKIDISVLLIIAETTIEETITNATIILSTKSVEVESMKVRIREVV